MSARQRNVYGYAMRRQRTTRDELNIGRGEPGGGEDREGGGDEEARLHDGNILIGDLKVAFSRYCLPTIDRSPVRSSARERS